jgi:hypothetical protein
LSRSTPFGLTSRRWLLPESISNPLAGRGEIIRDQKNRMTGIFTSLPSCSLVTILQPESAATAKGRWISPLKNSAFRPYRFADAGSDSLDIEIL